MRMILRTLLIAFVLSSSSCFALDQGRYSELNVRVVDETGDPVSGADAKIGFSFASGNRGLTDEDGRISHAGKQTGTWFVQIKKEGYYETAGDGPMAAPPPLVTVVLKRKIDPVPMVVGEVPGGFLPATGKPIEYDLEKADWLPPYGNGSKADLTFEGEMVVTERDGRGSPATWWVELSMSFSNPDDGFIVFDGVVPIERNDPESELVSIQKAPEAGYQQREMLQRVVREPYRRTSSFNADTHYMVFRVRTELDEDGNALSGHYGKIYRPMHAGPLFPKNSIWLKSIFYFNPTPNNRSLEFNKENLNPNPPSRGFAY